MFMSLNQVSNRLAHDAPEMAGAAERLLGLSLRLQCPSFPRSRVKPEREQM